MLLAQATGASAREDHGSSPHAKCCAHQNRAASCCEPGVAQVWCPPCQRARIRKTGGGKKKKKIRRKRDVCVCVAVRQGRGPGSLPRPRYAPDQLGSHSSPLQARMCRRICSGRSQLEARIGRECSQGGSSCKVRPLDPGVKVESGLGLVQRYTVSFQGVKGLIPSPRTVRRSFFLPLCSVLSG